MTQAEATSTEPVTNPYCHAVDVGLAFVSGYTGPERDHKSMAMYGAIVGLAEKRVDEGTTAPDYFCFTPQEILNAMASGADRDATEAGRRVNRYWGKLEGLQNEWQTNIQDEANHGTQSHLPWISKVASSGRHPSAYQFEAKPIDSRKRPREFPVPPGGIRYRCERSKPKKQRIFHVGVPMTR